MKYVLKLAAFALTGTPFVGWSIPMRLRTLALIGTVTLGLFNGALPVEAQQAGKVYRVGWLRLFPSPPRSSGLDMNAHVNGSDKDMFFHSSNLEGVSYEELQEGQRVSYDEGQGPKGPRTENVKLV